ncbi:MAG: hypothetical protein IV100_04960 [Myxococcales bacterium]|nr:hypothetical protein [Myxococcales bacterium]
MFFLSGSAGLIYQVVWVRCFGNVFGSTVQSASLVTALFMIGLGGGAWLLGRWADGRVGERPRTPSELVRAYAYLEAGIGLFGLLIAVILPMLEPLSAWITSYTPDVAGRLVPTVGTQLARFAIATLLLMPMTVMMGGTLTVLARAVVRGQVERAGSRIGLLYGVNTLGAAVGAFSVDLSLVPGLGLFAAQAIAAALNLLVCLLALRWADRMKEPVPPVTEVPTAPTTTAAEEPMPPPLAGIAAALAVSGAAAMGFEMLWFRALGSILGGHRSTFSLLLGTILTAFFLGALLGGVLSRYVGPSTARQRFERAATAFACSQWLLAGVAPFLLGRYRLSDYFDPAIALAHAQGTSGGRALIEVWMSLAPILAIVAAPALLMGLAYPLGNAMIQSSAAAVGSRAGLLYLSNTLGGVVGSLAAGFALIPSMGMQRSALWLGVLAFIAGVIPVLTGFWRSRSLALPRVNSPMARLTMTACAMLGVGGVLGFSALAPDHLMSQLATVHVGSETVLTVAEGPNETIAVTEVPSTGERKLWTNGHPMTGTTYMAQRYMRAFVHLPMLLGAAGEEPIESNRALVICFGVGNTVHAATLHPELESIDVADVSESILDHAPWFRTWNHDVLTSPKVHVHLNDGRQHLRAQTDGAYRLITLEPPPLTHAGVAALYSRDFYEIAKQKLARGGYLTQWLPLYQVPSYTAMSLIKAFIDVFPGAVLANGYGRELILIGRNGGTISFDPDEVASRLEHNPALLADLRAIDLSSLTELVTSFVANHERMVTLTQGVAALTDDLPGLEYAPNKLPEAVIPIDLYGIRELPRFCPKCATARADLPLLAETVDLLTGLYASEPYLVISRTRPIAKRYLHTRSDPALLRAARQASGYLTRIIPDAAIRPTL